MLTLLTWLWKQPGCRTTYNARHVNIWADMIRRNISMDHRLACVTDIPEGIDPEITIIRPPGEFNGLHTSRWPAEKPSCYRRLAMFRKDAADIFGERFVQIDLDVVIGGALDPLFDRPDDIVLFRGTSGRRPYNGSMTMMTAGCRPHVYDTFTKEEAEAASRMYVGSDQAWMMHALGPGEKTWGEEDGVWWYGSTYHHRHPRDLKMLFFPGRIKPWSIPGGDPYVRKHYQGSEKFDLSLLQRVKHVARHPDTRPRMRTAPRALGNRRRV